MILYPAIDLKNGECVRLMRGDMNEATVYNTDPAAQAQAWQQAGFSWLHVVDLDGAVSGKTANKASVDAILRAVNVPVQLGGGIRSLAAIEGWLVAGVKRIVLGTAAVKNPQLVRDACQKFPGRIAVGIDARDGYVATEGWGDTSSIRAADLARQLEDAGVSALIFTDISRDGTKGGVNIAATTSLAQAVRIPVIASGGVGNIYDIEALLPYTREGIAGVIVGRALYDGSLDPQDAIATVRAAC